MLSPLSATPYTWSGAGSDTNWNNPSNWSPAGPPNGDSDDTIFGDFGASPLTVTLSGSSPRTYMYINDLTVNTDAQANLTFAAPNDSIVNNITLDAGSYSTVTLTNASRFRVSQGFVSSPLQWNIAAGKTLNFTPSLLSTGGTIRQLEKTGAGTWNFSGSAVGVVSAAANDNRSVSIEVSEGTLALSQGVGQTLSYISSTVTNYQPTLSVASGATLAMDIGAGGT